MTPDTSQLPSNTAPPASDEAWSAGVAPVVEQTAPLSPSVARVNITLDLPPGARVRLTVESLTDGITVVTDSLSPTTVTKTRIPSPARRSPLAMPAPLAQAGANFGLALAAGWTRLRAALRVMPLATWLFIGAGVIYLATRFYALEDFPIYFFTDEAVHANLAADFIRDGLHNYDHEFLPTYFSLGPSFGLNSVSVYLQVIPYLVFGKSIFVTRAVSVLVTLFGAAMVGLTLRDIFKVRYWWAGVLLLSIAPTWFFHSRTAFEYIEVASFYAGFIYFYARYRCDAPRYLYAAVVLGALVFYTHGLGQILMLTTAGLLFLTDWPYHWRNRAVVVRGLGLAVLLALPYFRYTLSHPSTFQAQLRQRDSYWALNSVPLSEKITRFVSEYLYGLSPGFWYLPDNGRDLARHVMKGYGNLFWPTLPLALLGLWQAIVNFRSPAHRVVLIALLASPVASALVAIGVPRMLWFVVPATVLTGLGLSASLEWLQRWRLPRAAVAVGVFVVLAGFNIYMLRDALVNGPLWFRDYTLDGMQYGAKQLFGEAIPQILAHDPNAQVKVSPSWANGTDLFVPFFLSPEQQSRVQLQSIDYYAYDKRPDLTPNTLLVMMAREYEQTANDPKFTDIRVEQILPYPDGTTGFYFVHLAYSPAADDIFAAAEAARRQPVEEQVTLDGQDVTVTHSQFGAGRIQDTLDGDTFTVVRGLQDNPLFFEFRFPQPRTITGLGLTLGSLDNFTVLVKLTAPGASDPVAYSETFKGLPPDPHVDLAFDKGPQQVSTIRIEIKNNLAGESAQIHVREIVFK
jgi:hypothetical protein